MRSRPTSTFTRLDSTSKVGNDTVIVRDVVAVLVGFLLAGCAGGAHRASATAATVPGRHGMMPGRGAIAVVNTGWKDWVNCSGSTNGDEVITMGGFFQAYVANGSSQTLPNMTPGEHTVTLSRKPGNYCWQTPHECVFTVVPGQTSTIFITGSEQVICPK